jgi:hypothetical protein
MPHIAQSFVHAENVSIAHLLHEAALLSHPSLTSGKAYTVTDPGLTATYRDLYVMLSTTCLTGFNAIKVPTLPLVFVAHVMELYFIVRQLLGGFGSKILPGFEGGLKNLQPSLFQICNSHQFANNAQVGLPPSKGGIGYVGACTTLEGMAQEVRQWNDEVIAKLPEGKVLRKDLRVPAAVVATQK